MRPMREFHCAAKSPMAWHQSQTPRNLREPAIPRAAQLPGTKRYPAFQLPAPRRMGPVGRNQFTCRPERNSIFRGNGSSAGPYCYGPWTVRGFDLLKGVTLYYWTVIDIAKRIGETKKRHSVDSPHWPRLRRNRQHHHAQAHARGRSKLPEDHFGYPLVLKVMTCYSRMTCGPQQAGASWLPGDRQAIPFPCGPSATVRTIRLNPGRRQGGDVAPTVLASEPQGREFPLRGIQPQAATRARRRR